MTGNDIRVARRTAGLSLRAAAAAVGLSYRVFARIERSELPNVTVLQLALACAAVGLEFSGRAYPDGDPVRDAAQLRLLERMRSNLPPGTRWQTEVAVPIPGDRRAIDAVAVLKGARVGVEAETKVADLQAIERRAQLKKRDGNLDVLVLLVANTRSNRQILREHAPSLRTAFPLDTRTVLAALRRGEPPRADGIVVL